MIDFSTNKRHIHNKTVYTVYKKTANKVVLTKKIPDRQIELKNY